TNAAKEFPGQIEVIDLRTIVPLDEKMIFEAVNRHGKCLVVTEEPETNTFAQSVAGLISKNCFESLDAPVMVTGSKNLPAIPLNSTLEAEMLPDTSKVADSIRNLLNY